MKRRINFHISKISTVQAVPSTIKIHQFDSIVKAKFLKKKNIKDYTRAYINNTRMSCLEFLKELKFKSIQSTKTADAKK